MRKPMEGSSGQKSTPRLGRGEGMGGEERGDGRGGERGMGEGGEIGIGVVV